MWPFARKESAVQAATLYFPTPRGLNIDAETVARESYGENPRVYAAIRMLSNAVSSIPWLAYEGDKEKEDHPALELIQNPNRYQSAPAFFEEIVGYLYLFGNNFMEAVVPPSAPSRPPKELYNHHPRWMSITPGTQNKVQDYRYKRGSVEIIFPPERMLHQKFFNPNDDYWGLSPLAAAAISIDQHNESKKWNLALLKNGAKPGGILFNKGMLAPGEVEALRKEIVEKWSGNKNAGVPRVLEGEWEWQPMDLTTGDMDWLEGQKLAARDIALALQIPPEMLGDTDSKTYSNYSESRRSLYTEAVLPLMDMLEADFNRFLAPRYGKNLRLVYDRDSIDAISEDRAAVWESAIAAVKAGVLTPNEARAIMQYEPIEGGDELRAMPDGQFRLVNPPDEEDELEEELSAIRLKKNERR